MPCFIILQIYYFLDPPHKTQPNENDDDLRGGNHTALDTKQEKDTDVKIMKTTDQSENSPVGPIVGVTFAIIILALIIVILFVVLRRRNEDGKLTIRTVLRMKDTNGSNRNSNDIDMMHLNIQRKESPLPARQLAVQRDHKQTNETKLNGHIPKTSSGEMAITVNPMPPVDTIPNGRPPSDIPMINTVANPNSIQNREWEHMLRQKDMTAEDEEEEERRLMELQEQHLQNQQNVFVDSPDNELPPPPPFLLDNDTGLNFNLSSYNDILDGYHSGDNIDDCIDDDVNESIPSIPSSYTHYT